VGALLGRKVVAVLTDMDQPLGRAVGNALEVREAIETLRGEGPADLTELCLVLGAKMLVLGEVATTEDKGRRMLEDSIASGKALDTFKAWVAAQGGDASVAVDTSLLPIGSHTHVVAAARAGCVSGFDAEGVGRAAMALGAGRARKEDDVDPGAGLVLEVKTGVLVEPGTPLATLYTNDPTRVADAEERLLAAVRIGDDEVHAPPLFHEV
jgi:pyrimidine-nucleoside phosphorylase